MDPAEVKQDDLDSDEMLIIWDIDVDEILSENAIAITPVVSPDVEEYPPALMVNINAENLHCNCSRFPNVDKVVISQDNSPRHSSTGSRPEGTGFVNNSGILNTYFYWSKAHKFMVKSSQIHGLH